MPFPKHRHKKRIQQIRLKYRCNNSSIFSHSGAEITLVGRGQFIMVTKILGVGRVTPGAAITRAGQGGSEPHRCRNYLPGAGLGHTSAAITRAVRCQARAENIYNLMLYGIFQSFLPLLKIFKYWVSGFLYLEF